MFRFEDLRVRDSDRIDRDFLNRRYRLIAESFASLAADVESVTTDSDNLVTLGLSRVNEVLTALATVQAAAQNGFLVATSNTPLTLSVNLETTFGIPEGTGRSLFAPTPYVVVTRADGLFSDWAVFRVDHYNRENGELAGEVVSINGDIGDAEYSDWVISDSAGLAANLIEAAVGVSNALTLAEQAATDAAAAAATAAAILDEGPVASVNGQTGVVSIGLGDIPGLTSQLGNKAAASHGHAIPEITGLQNALASLQAAVDGRAPAAHGHAISGIAGLQAALDGKASTSHGHGAGDTIDGGTY